MAEITTTGKTVDEAIEEGLRILGITRDEASIEIIDMPAKKLFRRIPAKVKITKAENDFSLAGLFGSTEPEKKAQTPVVEEKKNDSKNDKKKPNNNKKKEAKPAVTEQQVKAEEKKEETVTEEKPAVSGETKHNSRKKKKKPAKKTENVVKKEETPAETADEAADTASEIIGYLTEEELPERAVKALAYLRSIVAAIGYEKVEYTFGKTERGIRFILSGDDAPSLIGRRGETMDALQYLCTVGSSRDGGDYCRISLDIEGYRSRREEALIELAAKTAAKVKKNHRSQSLEPMNPYERRIVHAAIQEIEGVTSHSVGSEPHRKVVVSLVGGSDDRRGRGDRRNGSRKNGTRKPRFEEDTVIPEVKLSADVSETSDTIGLIEKPVVVEKKISAPLHVKKELKSTEEFVGALYGKIEL